MDALKEYDEKLAATAVAARVDGALVDLFSPLDASSDIKVEPVTLDSPEGTDICRHSASHVMAQAVKELYPTAKVAIGPTIEDGFYYDFDVADPFTPEDLKKIEKKMKQIIKSRAPIKRELSKAALMR